MKKMIAANTMQAISGNMIDLFLYCIEFLILVRQKDSIRANAIPAFRPITNFPESSALLRNHPNANKEVRPIEVTRTEASLLPSWKRFILSIKEAGNIENIIENIKMALFV